MILRYNRCNIMILMAATAWLMLSFSSCTVCGFDSYSVHFKCPQRKFLPHESDPHKIQEMKDNISYAVAAIRITMLHRVYLNMVTARLLNNCSNTLRLCFSTAGPRPGTGPWHQLHRAAKGSPGICRFSFLSNFHE